MPKRSRKPRKPDVNEIAADIVKRLSVATGEPQPEEPTPKNKRKDPAAVALGRRGGLKGGPARAKKLSAKKRAAIAKKAAKARWSKA